MFGGVSERDELPAGSTIAKDLYRRIVIAAHHPDRLRRPAASAGAHDGEHFLQTLTWNVFRTLELLPPAFWLRRLHAGLRGEAPGAASQTVQVHLWRELPLPAVQRIDGARPDVVVDVLIETEHAVWTLMAATANDRRCIDSDPGRGDMTSQVIDAGSWFAGTRDCYFGLLQSTDGGTPAERVLVSRYSRSRDSLRLRAGSRVNSLANVREVGRLRWTQLATTLQDCARAAVLTDIERELARNALTWLGRVGVQPSDALIV